MNENDIAKIIVDVAFHIHQETGPGLLESVYEIILVDDFVKILWDLTEGASNQIYNIGAGVEYSIRDFAKMICREVNFPFEKVTFDIDRYVGAKSKCLNINKAIEFLPQYQLTPLDDGLRKTITWFYDSRAFNSEKS